MFRPCLLAIATLLLVACNSATTQPTSNSATTQPTSNSQKVSSRVVTLTSLSADIVSELAPSKLVGMTGNKLLDKEARFKQITQVSRGQAPPNLEKIIALKPDLVIGNPEFHTTVLDKLKSLGINTIAVKVRKWDDLPAVTKTLASAIGAKPDLLLQRYQSCLKEPPTKTESPSVLVLVSRQPIIAPNKDSWAGEMVTKFGGKNSVADLQGQGPMSGYINLSAEKVLQANPDMIFVVETSEGLMQQFKSDPFWQKLKATKNNKVYTFDYFGLINPGSISKIEETCTRLAEALSNKPKP